VSEKFEEIERLGKLLDEGKISQDEFERLKGELLDGPTASTTFQPGWYTDPTGETTRQAYWDGQQWTGATRTPSIPASTPTTPPAVTGQPGRSGCLMAFLIIIALLVLASIVGLIAVRLAGKEVVATFSEIGSGLDASSSCHPLSASETSLLADAWTGNGALTVEATAKANSFANDTFTEIWFLQGTAPGVDGQVYVFATKPGGLLVGAEPVTREFFDWGADVSSDSPMGQSARDALNSAPDCLG
jgi:Protein of unknown function (DUF2510)